MGTSDTGQLAALALADGRLPTGGHAQSGGLEPALAAGLTVEGIPDYIRGRLGTVGLVEAGVAVLSRRTAASASSGSSAGTELTRIAEEALARTPSAPLRRASAQVGRGLQRLAERLWPEAGPVDALRRLAEPPRPVALGVVAALAGVDDHGTARLSLYDDAQSVAGAAPKLLPVDPTEPVRWVLAAAELIETLATRAAAVSGLDDLPAATAPLSEQWSLEHTRRERRIFHA